MINNFPTGLQPIIQQGFLIREFQQALTSRNSYRLCAERIETEIRIGENGEHASGNEVAEFQINHYAAVTDLTMAASRIGIASQFLQNAYTNGEQAARGLEELARNALRKGFKSDPDSIIRINHRDETAALLATDTLVMQTLLNAVGQLLNADIPQIEGAYNCYLDPVSARQLFSDPDFKSLFQGATSINQVFRKGMLNDFLGLRFMPITEPFIEQHPSIEHLFIRHVFVCGAGAVVEADFKGMSADSLRPTNAIVDLVDGVAMVTREPVDSFIAQSWYWIGGFGPRMRTDGRFARAVCLEHVA